MNSTSKHMERAIALAVANVATGAGGPFGAVVVLNGEAVAEGANCVTGTNDPTAHAEVVAIRLACEKLRLFHLEGCEIYTSCEPCPMCLAAIYWAHIEKVHYGCTHSDAAAAGFDDSLIYHEMRRGVHDRRVPMTQMQRDDALRAFEAWSTSTSKRPY